MAVTKLTDLVNPQVMGDMIEAKIPAMLKFTPFAAVDNTLQGVAGDTKTVPVWAFVGAAENIAEGDEITPSQISASASRTFTVSKAMKSVSITQEAVNSGLGDPVAQAEKQLGQAVAVKLDNDVLAAALGSSAVYDGTAAKITYTAVVSALDVFNEEELTEKAMFVAPTQVTELRKDQNFIDKSKYGNDVMMTGEIGMIGGARIIPSKKVPKVKATLAASTTEGATKITSNNIATYEGCVWDATNSCMAEIAVNDYVKAVSNAYFLNPIIKLEPADAETEYTEDELPALTVFLKKDTQVDTEWFPKAQKMDITVAKYYGVALTNEEKVVVAQIKA